MTMNSSLSKCCDEYTPFSSKMWPFVMIHGEINIFIFGLLLIGGLSLGWSLKRDSTVFKHHMACCICAFLQCTGCLMFLTVLL